MKFSPIASRTAFGALAIALSVGAVPALAQDAQAGRGRPTMSESRGAAFAQAREQRQQAQQVRQEARQDQQVQQRAERQQWQGRQQAQVQQRQVDQQQSQAQRQQWQGQRQDAQRNDAQRQQWQGRQDAQRNDDQRRQWQNQQQAQVQSQQWQAQQQRNRTYTDRNRSATYGGYDRNRSTYGYQNNQYAYQNQRNQQQWDRTWRNDQRYDWQRYRTTNRNVFNLGVYYSPYRNYSYRRVGVGSILQQLFYSNNYWINDPYRYRLPEVYGPYRWVRYYDDALLVDIYSGQVVDVLNNFFW